MAVSPIQISLDTLIAASPILGHALEDRKPIRESQDQSLIDHWQSASDSPLRGPSQQNLFCVAPLDLLVEDIAGKKQFHLLELNGTGIGGLTNMTNEALVPTLASLAQMTTVPGPRDPLILIASSGKESEQNPRLNRLIHEKLLYADAIRSSFHEQGLTSKLLVMPELALDSSVLATEGPTVVVGYIKEFLEHLSVSADGQLTLFGRPVTGVINDRFFLNVLDHFDQTIDLSSLVVINRCYMAGADKGIAYDLLNDFIGDNPQPAFPPQVNFDICCCREELTETVFSWLRRGSQPVIKPHGTGLGHGIEFFLSPGEADASILKRIDRSIRLTEEFYHAKGGAFPYTVCQYVNASTVDRPGHRLHGHKFELRVVVYRDKMSLRAFPSIVKVACEPMGALDIDPSGLINNITASCMRTQAKGTDFMFPLANRETLDMFGLHDDQMISLCRTATGYVRYVLDQVEDCPQRFGLPMKQTEAIAA